MCLTTSKQQTDKFTRIFNDGDTLKVWKIYRKAKDDTTKSGYKLEGRYAYVAYGRGIEGSSVRKSGTVHSNRKYRGLGKYFPINDHYHTYSGFWDVNKGIHVYTTREAAVKIFEYDRLDQAPDDYVIVCCHANIDDLVAANNFDLAVFMKVSISPRNFRRAILGK